MSHSQIEKFKNLAENVTHEVKNIWKNWFLFVVSVLLFFLFVLIIAVISYQEVYKNKIYPGVSVGYFNVGGHTRQAADEFLIGLTEKPLKEGLTFVTKGTEEDKQFIIPTILISAADPDLSREILSFDFNATLNTAWQYGRRGDFLNRLKEQARLLLIGSQAPVVYKLNEEMLLSALKEKISYLENPGRDAELQVTNGEVSVIPEKPGNSFDYEKALKDTRYGLESLTFRPVLLGLKIDNPKIRASDTSLLAAQAKHILNFASTTLLYEGKTWRLENRDLEKFLDFKLIDSPSLLNKVRGKKEVALGLDQASTTAFLQTLAAEIDIEPQDAKFEVASTTAGRLKAKFQPSSDGKKLNIPLTLAKMEEEIISKDNHEIELVVVLSKPRLDLASINTYGIKEVVGVGESNFSGSPPNRRHNIKNAAQILNGVLIAPDEEFSLIQAIGPVNAATGFLPELVIKGNRTVPEYGGGLCQIGTTTFRVALYVGVPITERRPHSYRVRYYEPAGMDATIYGPHPDVRFINDTGNYLVLTTEIEGDILRFKLYGTRDGREVYVENPPRLWNITYPGPTKIIETTDLTPGVKNCIETSHQGADTEFVRKVTYADGREPIDEKWFSRYRAWQAVCLLGVEQLSSSTSPGEVIE